MKAEGGAVIARQVLRAKTSSKPRHHHPDRPRLVACRSKGLSRVSDLVMVGLLLVRACSSLRLVDSGRSAYRLRCPIAQSHGAELENRAYPACRGEAPWSTTLARQGDRELEAAFGPRAGSDDGGVDASDPLRVMALLPPGRYDLGEWSDQLQSFPAP
jgi:hypothetical protein